jgi:ABC-2 type transport system permease protein
MSTSATALPPATARAAATVLRPPSLGARLLGLGSIFGKSFRDSRTAAIVLGVVLAVIFVVTASQIAAQFETLADRLQMALELQSLPPVFQGMLGEPINIERLGGFMSWRILNFMPVMIGIWAIVAMSGLLGGEISRGSMDLVASAPIARARIAVQKLLGYMVALALATVLLVAGMVVAFAAFATLPGDEATAEAIVAHAAWLFVMVLFPGAIAFALAPVLGRGPALGAGAVVLFGSFIINGFSASVATFDQIKGISYFSVTALHRPLAGSWDWPSVAAIAGICGLLLVTGVLAFARRDLLVPTGGRLRFPTIGLFLRGPFTRAIGERLPAAVIWGLGLGLFGAIIASSADEFVETIGKIPQIVEMIRAIFPDEDLVSTGGFIQLAFFSEAIIVIGLAAGGFVGSWASDEADRRLEVILGAPVGRTSWAIRSGAAVMVAIAVMTAVMAGGVVVGAATQAGNALAILPGLAVLGLYGMALAGIGLAVGGLIRPSLAAPVTIILGLAFYLLDLIGSILDLPDVVLDLALNRHLGRPILGTYDEVGLIACAVLAIGGVVLCAIGMRRRDIGR